MPNAEIRNQPCSSERLPSVALAKEGEFALISFRMERFYATDRKVWKSHPEIHHGFRPSAFGFPSGFGLRASDFPPRDSPADKVFQGAP
jgi:hypothetical protein